MAQVIRINLKHRPDSERTVADLIEARARTDAKKTFLFYEDQEISYEAFNQAANKVARWAFAKGVEKGQVITLMMESRPEFLVTWAGLAKLGATTALINTNLKGRALHFALTSSGGSVLIAGAECLEALASLREIEPALTWETHIWSDPLSPRTTELPEGFSELDPEFKRQPEANLDRGIRSGLLAGKDLFYIYTSGTTGFPKATHFSHTRFFASGDVVASLARYGPRDVIYNALPLYHGAGGAIVPSIVLQRGCSMVLKRKFSASEFWNDCRKYQVTGFQYVGEFCRYLINQPEDSEDRKNSVRCIHGAGLRPEIWEPFVKRFGISRVLEGYGSTEGNTAMMNLDNKPGAVGRIPFKKLHNGRLIRFDVETNEHLRDEEGLYIECEPDEIGEFIGQIREHSDSGYDTFIGYTAKEETEKKILHDVFEEGDAWFKTGDLFYRDADEFYYFVDRVGDTFRWKSENVSTQEVAELLSIYPGIDFVNVYGVEVPGEEGRAGMAALVMSPDADFNGTEFYHFTQNQLPEYAAPYFVRLCPEADVTGTFKLRKVDLQKEGYDIERVDDPIYMRRDKKKSYVRLNQDNYPFSQKSESTSK
ncbi:MAG: long-chain-acyl-CoA synthetase [Deltaproteobacteria bacterium]|nr:long-chain-acyl-CoA synthetase [Deltaproteobacteria bacterium]